MVPLGWNPFGAVGVGVMLVACAMGAFIYLTRPEHPQNRLLALALWLGGLSAGFYFGFALLARDEATAARAIAVGVTLLIPMPAVYLLFLATIRTRWTRLLASSAAWWVLAAYTVAGESLWVLRPELFLDDLIFYPALGGWHFSADANVPGVRVASVGALVAAQLFGLVVAISAYRHALTEGARRQAQAFAVAFGTRDLLGAAFAMYFAGFAETRSPVGDALFVVGVPAIDFVFYLLLGYGILQAQLFDIDLRIKWAVERSAVAAPFAVAFFVASEALEALVPIDGFWLGLLAAGAIVLALRPIQRFASVLSERLMPGVAPTAEYLRGRKDQVYRNAVEAILENRFVTQAERRLLDRLRRDLGLSDEQAAAIESDTIGSLL